MNDGMAVVDNSLGMIARDEGDYTTARSHFQKSVDKGNGFGCSLLAEMWERGWGGPPNAQTALGLYDEAVKRGYEPARQRADALRQQQTKR